MKRKLHNCKVCAKPIRWKSTVSKKRYDQIQFCSNECYYRYHRKINRCKYCDIEIVTTKSENRKYCSKYCLQKQKQIQKQSCNTCGKLCIKTPLQFGRKVFCSHNCFINDIGYDKVNICPKCGNPIYTKNGNYKTYQLIKQHRDCSIYDGY